MLRFLTAGESHGKCLVAILEGMVAGLSIDAKDIDRELLRRQQGYGRGGRMTIEQDRAQILSGLRFGRTLGSPIALQIPNRDFKIESLPAVDCPRPGHADLSGVMKYGHTDARNVLERASARETAARVAVGALCKIFLSQFDVEILSHVVCVGGVWADTRQRSFDQIKRSAERSEVRCADPLATKKMIQRISAVKIKGDTVGGVFEIMVRGLPPGMGSYVHYDRRLSGCLCGALASIQAVKAVEIGIGHNAAELPGSQVQDEVFYAKRRGVFRKTNRAGGLEGGMTNGEMLVLRAAMKPISTLMEPLRSFRLRSKAKAWAAVERSDVTAVPAAGVVGEAMTAFELVKCFLEKFGGDGLGETKRNYEGYLRQLKAF